MNYNKDTFSYSEEITIILPNLNSKNSKIISFTPTLTFD